MVLLSLELHKILSRALLIGLIACLACSKPKTLNSAKPEDPTRPDSEQFAVSASELKNCRFTRPEVVYAKNQPITPNPVLCDSGVATFSEVLSARPLPAGLRFSASTLRLEGTPTEASAAGVYRLYLENSSGYLIIPLRISVQ